MITSKMIEARVAMVEVQANKVYGNCPHIFIDNDGDDYYNIMVEYSDDDKEIQWTVAKGLKGEAVLDIINNELLGIIKRIYAAAEEDESRLTLRDKFLEVCDKFPYLHFLGKREETMLGECMTWCRDYFGGPKDEMLAYMILGYWQNKMELEAMEAKRQRERYEEMLSHLKSISYSDHSWEMDEDEYFEFDDEDVFYIKCDFCDEIHEDWVEAICYDRGNSEIKVIGNHEDYFWHEIDKDDQKKIVDEFLKQFNK